MSFICHIHNYTEYNEEWNVFSAFNPSKCTHLEQWAADCAAPGEQSWTSCRRRDSNPQPWVTSGFKSNALSIRPTTALFLNSLFSSKFYKQYPIMITWKKFVWNLCKFIKYKKRQNHMYVSIHSLCHDTQNWAQEHPVSTEHPWDVSTTWLGSPCSKFSWLDMILKGTYLSI